MNKIDLDTAPFDVGMEWPEELWEWAFDDECVMASPNEEAVLSVSAKGITVWAMGFPDCRDGVPVSKGFPVKWDGDHPEDAIAVVLLDDNGIEIDRRALK